jgi:hypothetical protein
MLSLCSSRYQEYLHSGEALVPPLPSILCTSLAFVERPLRAFHMVHTRARADERRLQGLQVLLQAVWRDLFSRDVKVGSAGSCA